MAKLWSGFGGATPFWPNWSGGYDVEYEFETRMNISRDGTEQRIAVRPYALGTLNYSSWQRGDQFEAAYLARAYPSQQIVLPFGARHVRLASAAALGDTVLTLTATAPGWIVAGGRLILHSDDQDEAVVVDSVSGDEITLTSALETGHDAGTRVYLGALGWREQKKNYRMVVRGFEVPTSRFELDAREPIQARTAALRTVDDAEVFDWRLNWGENPTRVEEPVLEESTSLRGLRDVSAIHAWEGFSRRESHLLTDADDVEAFIDFFLRHRGRQKAFLAREYLPPLVATATPFTGPGPLAYNGPGPRIFTVADEPQYLVLHPHEDRKTIYGVTVGGGEEQIVHRIPTKAGTTEILPTFHRGSYPVGDEYALVQIDGPGEAHIDAGLVSISVSGKVNMFYGSGDAVRVRVTVEVEFDRRLSSDDDDLFRWSGVVRIPGTYGLDSETESVDRPDGGDPDGAAVSITVPVPAFARFAKVYLSYVPLAGFGSLPETLEWGGSVQWSAGRPWPLAPGPDAVGDGFDCGMQCHAGSCR